MPPTSSDRVSLAVFAVICAGTLGVMILAALVVAGVFNRAPAPAPEVAEKPPEAPPPEPPAPAPPVPPFGFDPPDPPKPKLPKPPYVPKPVEAFALLAPAVGEEPLEVKFDDTVADVAVAGGGRFLVLQMEKSRHLAVFDVGQAKVVGKLPLPKEGDVLFTAGMDKVFVYSATDDTLRRYSLRTLEKTISFPKPMPKPLTALVMGAGSNGPLLVSCQKGREDANDYALLDPESLETIDLERPQLWSAHFSPPAVVRASADGKLFSGAFNQFGRHEGAVHHVSGNAERVRGVEFAAIPDPSGRYLFGDSYVRAMEDLWGGVWRDPRLTRDISFAPSDTGGDLYLRLWVAEEPKPGKPAATFSINAVGESRPVVLLPHVPPPQFIDTPGFNKHRITADKQVKYFPTAKVVAVLAFSRDKLHLYPAEADALLAKADPDYLRVTSRPPTVPRDPTYKYEIAVKARHGPTKLELIEAPAGMKLEGNALTWEVPKGWHADARVIVGVTDRKEKEQFHTFTLHAPHREPGTPVPLPPREFRGDPVRAPEKAVAITPTKAANKAEVKLPGKSADVCFGGGGRYLLFRIPGEKQAAVLDVCEGKLLNPIPLLDDTSLVAAGMSHAFTVSTESHIIRRFDLATGKKEASAANPHGAADRVMMGHATDGPLYAGGFIDAATFKPIYLKYHARPTSGNIHLDEVRVSADGRVYGWSTRGRSPSGLRSLVITPERVTTHDEHNSVGSIFPGPTGELFTSAGIRTPDLKPIGRRYAFLTGGPQLVPGAHGPYYLEVDYGAVNPNKPEKREPGLILKSLDDDTLSVRLGKPAGLTMDGDCHERLFLVPRAKVLVVLNSDRETVHLHAVDFPAKK